MGPLTNQTEGGDGSSIISEETRQKLSALTKGIPKTEEHKKKLADANKGKHEYTDDMKEHLRQINIGKKSSEETKQKLSIRFLNVPKGPMKDSTKELLRQQHLGKPLTEDHKQKISDGLKAGGHKPSEYCTKMSVQKRIGVPRDDATKEKLRQANLGKKLSEQTRQKMRDAHQKRKQEKHIEVTSCSPV